MCAKSLQSRPTLCPPNSGLSSSSIFTVSPPPQSSRLETSECLCFFLSLYPPGAFLVAQMVNNLPAMQETWDQSLGQEDPLEKETATHSSTLPGEIHGQRSLAGYSPWGHKESACNVEDPGSILGSGRSPGKGNGNHSSILAWRNPWTEEPGSLQSMRSKRVGHNRRKFYNP